MYIFGIDRILLKLLLKHNGWTFDPQSSLSFQKKLQVQSDDIAFKN